MHLSSDINVFEYRYNDKSFVSLVSRDCCPICPYSSNYINIELSGKAFNTKVRYAHELMFVLNYFLTENPSINLVERVKQGVLLSRGEINSFVNSARFKNKSEYSNVVSIHRYSDKALENAIHASGISVSCVKAGTAKGRIRRLSEYLSFIYREWHSDFVVPEHISQRYEQLQYYLADSQSALRDFDNECVGFSESVIPNDVFFMLLEIMQPESPRNPFKHSKLRNCLIVSLFLETGLRRGAIAKLKIEHCKFNSSFDEILITRSPDDTSDPRKKRPQQKTKAHRSFCPPELMHQLKRYLNTTRSRFPASEFHEFLFISELDSKGTAGQPLTLGSFNRIFDVLSKTLNYRIYPHLLRYKWNEIFTEKAESRELSSVELDKLRKYAMGWSRDSKMGLIYNEFKDAEAVREIQRVRQSKIVSAGDTHE